jgi:hypothetical protein
MNEKYLVLERNIRSDLEAIDRLFQALGSPELAESEPQESLIVVAYRVHSLYTAFENIFRNIDRQARRRGGHPGGDPGAARSFGLTSGTSVAFVIG